MRKLFTSESVTEGHPDKLCDQVSDAVLDAILAEDPNARVACETFATTGMITVMGEITTSTYVDIPAIVRKTVVEIGYDSPEKSFNGNTCAVMTAIHEQSPDIAMGVDDALETRGGEETDTGAGDQGMMFLRTTVHGVFVDDRPVAVDTIVVSAQHAPDVSPETIREDILKHVVTPVVPAELLTAETRFFINPTGRFVIGGPAGDTGLTGRKIIVDTYGGYAPHGGGCFSGKDPTKVDRSAAYAARYAAKNVVAAGLADRCQIQLAYAIGVAEPVSILVDTFGTGKADEEKIAEAVRKVFDFRPAAIIRDLDLRRPIYRQTAAYGHFGRTDIDLPWEKEDKTEALKTAIG